MIQLVTYVQSVFLAKTKASDLPPDRLREMRTLCVVLNLFGEGKLAVAADVSVQRFKALIGSLSGRASRPLAWSGSTLGEMVLRLTRSFASQTQRCASSRGFAMA